MALIICGHTWIDFFSLTFYTYLGCVKYWNKLPSVFLNRTCVEIIVSSSLMLCWWKLSDTLLKYWTIMEERLNNLHERLHEIKTTWKSTIAKPVVTISNSPINVRIADIPLLDIMINAVGVPSSQAHHVDKFVSEHYPLP